MLTRTKAANYIVALAFIILGIVLDMNNAVGFQGLHHAAFIAGGVFLGFGIKKD